LYLAKGEAVFARKKIKNRSGLSLSKILMVRCRLRHIFHSRTRKKYAESHSANKSIAFCTLAKFFYKAKFKFYEFEGVTPRSFAVQLFTESA